GALGGLASGLGSGGSNGCNLCHLDRSLGWTADHLARWYGAASPELSADDRRIAAGARWALEGDAGVRALVAWSMGWTPAQGAAGAQWRGPHPSGRTGDPHDAVPVL